MTSATSAPLDSTSGRLRDKIIVVIGGTSGLGESAVRACHREGARVVAVGRDASKCQALQQSLGENSHAFSGDAREEHTAEQAIAEAVDRFGRCDGLYHVAGGSGRAAGDGPLHQLSLSGWRETLRSNLDALFLSNRAAVRHFLARQSPGSILNMGSVLADSPAPAYFATHAYAAAKAAIVGLTKSSAAYYAPFSIRFNCVLPALVETPMSQRAVADKEIMEFIERKQPLGGGRVGRAEDLDAAVVFFLSDESRFVTGQALCVDGGWSISDAAATLTDDARQTLTWKENHS